MALKMIEVLGQLVRSFASTLDLALRRDIVLACTNVGLRFLGAMYQLKEDDVRLLQDILRALIKEKHSSLTDEQLTGRANAILLFNYHGLTYGVLRKIAYSMGAKDLKADYTYLFGKDDASIRDKIVFAAIKLENYSDPNVDEIIRLGRHLFEENPFLRDVLRQLVATYRNYAGVINAKDRQKLESEFELEGAGLGLKNQEKSERKYLDSGRGRYNPPNNKRRS